MSKAIPLSFQVQGLSWPEKIGDFTLMGPVNRLGHWRCYAMPQREGDFGRIILQIKVNNSLEPIASFSRQCKTRADHALWEKLVKQWFATTGTYGTFPYCFDK